MEAKSQTERPKERGTVVPGTRSREGLAKHIKPAKPNTTISLKNASVSQKQSWIAKVAKEDSDFKFLSLAHWITIDVLEEAFLRLKRDASPGIDRVTVMDYGQNLGDNLRNLLGRLKDQTYRAQPVRRVYIGKEGGKRRPIGVPALEDKIVQKATAMLLEPIYECDFHDSSYGFRPRRNPHMAMDELRRSFHANHVRYVIDADIESFFDTVKHGILCDFLKRRVKDRGILRLVGKWLKCGVMEKGQYQSVELGTPQGGVLSPLLANVYLHYVLDEWFHKEIQPRLRGRSTLIRYADDFVIGLELQSDAQRLMKVLGKRFARFGLRLHPEKTRLVWFWKPYDSVTKRPKGIGTFDFLGFTYYRGKTRQGRWEIKRKTIGKRLRRAVKNMAEWLKTQYATETVDVLKKLAPKMRGHYVYFGVRCNSRALSQYERIVQRLLFRFLNRRGGKTKGWNTFKLIWSLSQMPKPRIRQAPQCNVGTAT